jgi:hypothetical protein
MIPRSRERRHGDRRAHARGGRRATDGLAVSTAAPECPSCGGAANEVGESDGGWWFVCASCDQLWNERERQENESVATFGDTCATSGDGGWTEGERSMRDDREGTRRIRAKV